MLDIFKAFATDAALELEGVWKEIGGGAELLIARNNNSRYLKAMDREYKAHKHALSGDNEGAEKLAEDLLIRVLATTILLGWKNLSWQGQPLEYSVQNAEMLLSVKDFRKLVISLSEDLQNFQRAEDEAVEKN